MAARTDTKGFTQMDHIKKKSYRSATLFDVRDCRGLKANAKVLLYTIELRGKLYSTGDKAAADMGVSRATFNRTVLQLKKIGLIHATPKTRTSDLLHGKRRGPRRVCASNGSAC